MLPSKLRHPLEFHHLKFVYSKIGWYQENRGISWTICLDPKMGWFWPTKSGGLYPRTINKNSTQNGCCPEVSTYTRSQNSKTYLFFSCSSNDISGYKRNHSFSFFCQLMKVKIPCHDPRWGEGAWLGSRGCCECFIYNAHVCC